MVEVKSVQEAWEWGSYAVFGGFESIPFSWRISLKFGRAAVAAMTFAMVPCEMGADENDPI